MQNEASSVVAGSSKLVDVYGDWISFHDAAVESVQIEREGPTITITFTTNDVVVKEGYEERELLALVTMRWQEVLEMSLSGVDPDENNWIDSLSLERKEGSIHTTLSRMHGIYGFISARRIEVLDVQPIDR